MNKNILYDIGEFIINNRLFSFFILLGVWCVDLTVTYLAITNYSYYLREANSIANFFFSHGLFGWVGFFFFGCFIIYSLLFLVPHIGSLINTRIKESKEKKDIRIKSHTGLGFSLFIFLDGLAIINNIALLIVFSYLL